MPASRACGSRRGNAGGSCEHPIQPQQRRAFVAASGPDGVGDRLFQAIQPRSLGDKTDLALPGLLFVLGDDGSGLPSVPTAQFIAHADAVRCAECLARARSGAQSDELREAGGVLAMMALARSEGRFDRLAVEVAQTMRPNLAGVRDSLVFAVLNCSRAELRKE